MATENLKLGRAWDDTFYEWTNDLELGKKLKKPKRAPQGTSMWAGAKVLRREVADYAGKGSKADVRGRLQGVAKRTRQVMVKITPGKNHTLRAVRKHLQYIGEDGQGVVHDQDGNEFKGKDAIEQLAWKWEHTGPQMPDETDKRLMFNIMFSMPEGTDERAVYAAVKATCEAEFAGHQWAMGQHFDEPQVHCHVAVKAEGMDGVRLNPRKADLQRWRERFAHELRSRGIEAEATKRATRLHQQRINKPWAVTRLEERNMPTNAKPAETDALRVAKWKKTEQKAASSYDRIVDALYRSSDAADRILAKQLEESIAAAKSIKPTSKRDNQQREIERN
jgi:hypothetical protein